MWFLESISTIKPPRLVRGQRPANVPPLYERDVAKALAWGFFLVALAAIGFGVWWALWGSVRASGTTPPPDRWLNVVLGLGAVAAITGVIGGAYLAARYGRRASVSVQAKAYEVPNGILIVARPSIRSVGIFRIRFQKNLGSVLTAWETAFNDDGKMQLGQGRPQSDVFKASDSFVEGAEELVTTCTLLLPPPNDLVMGWTVYLEIRARHRFMYYLLRVVPNVGDRGYLWTDQVFVPRQSVTREV